MNHPDDVKQMSLEDWKNDGQHPHWVKMKQHNRKLFNIKFCGGKPTKNSNYCLHKMYFVH